MERLQYGLADIVFASRWGINLAERHIAAMRGYYKYYFHCGSWVSFDLVDGCQKFLLKVQDVFSLEELNL
jgi:hypothetical protein